MKKYNVTDIRNFGSEAIVIKANSPLEAAAKCFPNNKVERDYSGKGDIVVGVYTNQYYGRGYRTFVYSINTRGEK